ncbi:Ribosome-recycling factor [Phytophthora nicotianae]|uniref:Ribosome-recycling factor n=1 Tax=Phytophthora nicotianae TaxID=4792 RepID=A0A0W8DRQ9_PHYNI|nr:Ribosome-recycling factor [Phytophthora nicotianae]
MEPKRFDIDEEELGCKIRNVKLSEKCRLKDEEKPVKDDESRAAQAKLDFEVEREWKQLQDAGVGKIEISNSSWAKKVCKGLTINHMNMRCADTGRLMWQSDEWGQDIFRVEQKARLPVEILKCPAVSREINFSSAEEITKFRLEQRVFLAEAALKVRLCSRLRMNGLH